MVTLLFHFLPWFQKTHAFLLFLIALMSHHGEVVFSSPSNRQARERQQKDLGNILVQLLDGVCVESQKAEGEWWAYSFCVNRNVTQFHPNSRMINTMDQLVSSFYISFDAEKPNELHQTFKESKADCYTAQGRLIPRTSEVIIKCCREKNAHVDSSNKSPNSILSVSKATELEACKYEVEVCSTHLCGFDALISTTVATPDNETDSPSSSSTNKTDYFGCYAAFTPNYPYCRGYEEVGYTCRGHYCAYDGREHGCLASCEACSVFYPFGVFDEKTATCLNPSDYTMKFIDRLEIDRQKKRVKDMFIESYDAYMMNAFPAPELRPLTCEGGTFDLVKVPMVTLIDTLDTLVIMQNYTEFRRAIKLVCSHLRNFDIDVNVSVFETNIRVLGGLLSAHLFAIDERLGIYHPSLTSTVYKGCMLRLAEDLAKRMLPAFNTTTGIPFGTVNLRKGVPKGETVVASTAGAGSLLIEFEILSTLVNNDVYGIAALKAVKGIYNHRNIMGLVGKHIDVQTGKWQETLSGVGSNSDSFYEYLFKSSMIFRNPDLFSNFVEVYIPIKKYVQLNNWFSELDLKNVKYRRHRFESLQAFWPGLEANLGLTESASKTLNTFFAIWQWVGFLPEELDYFKLFSGKIEANLMYPLRPELIESTYYQYRSTSDNTWLSASIMFLDSIQSTMKGECGYAAIQFRNGTTELLNVMPSFFLSETLKYLYLIFDVDNFINLRPYIFSTEAHPFDTVQIHSIAASMNHSHFGENYSDDVDEIPESTDKKVNEHSKKLRDSLLPLKGKKRRKFYEKSKVTFPTKCRKLQWHEYYSGYNSFDTNYQLELSNDAALGRFSELHDDWTTNLPGFVANFRSPTATSRMKTKMKTSKAAIERKQRDDVCYDDPSSNFHDEEVSTPSPSKLEHGGHEDGNGDSTSHAPKEISRSRKGPGKGQSVRINLEELGEFEIGMFADAFTIESFNDGNLLEVSNLGRKSIFISDSGGNEHLASIPSSTLASSYDGTMMKCHVSVTIPSGVQSYYRLTEEEDNLFGHKDCSISAFGPTAQLSRDFMTMQVPVSSPIQGENMVVQEENIIPLKTKVPTEHIMVSGPVSIADDVGFKGCEETIDETQNEVKEHTEKNLVKGAFRWLLNKLFRDNKEEDANVNINANGSGGHVLLMNRGDCTFEKKVELAESKGAIGAVVVNNDQNVFLMSGSTGNDIMINADDSTDDDFDDITRRDNDSNSVIHPRINIPSVMISKNDNISLMESYRYISNNFGIAPNVQVEIFKESNFVNNVHMGDYNYPKVIASRQFINVLSRGSWGVILSTNGELQSKGDTNMMEWKLYITDKTKDSFFTRTTWTMKTLLGSKVNVRQQISHDGITIYKRLLQRRCTDSIDVDDSSSSFILRR